MGDKNPNSNGNGNNGNDSNQTLADVQSFPVLTKEVGFTGSTQTGVAGQSAYGQIVHTALQDILGWRPRPGDAKGFSAALNQSFYVKEAQGHTEWKWMPRTFAIEVDLGAVTGAQASIYSRAKAALDHSMPLLEGLTPLRSDPDTQDVEAIRAIVRSEFMELVYELGLEGGPRLFRVDELFNLLLGNDPQLRDPEEVTGQLGLLRDRFGLSREKVNTIDEEHNLTNFLIIVDNVNSLRQTWETQRHFFDREGTDVFFGTQMVQLSRALAVLAESVQENYYAMDSVFLGEAERQVTELTLNGRKLLLGELLSRAEGFASEEGPRLIREGGKDGLIHAFRPTAQGLSNLVQAAADLSRNGSSNPVRGYHTPRVQRSLEETATHLKKIVELSSQVKRLPDPFPIRLTPDSADPGSRPIISIEGAKFQNGARVRLERNGSSATRIEGINVIVIDERIIQATFVLGTEPADTTWALVVTNPDGTEGTLQNAFRINPPDTLPAPVISSLDPNSGAAGETLTVIIEGQWFQLDATCDFGEGITVEDLAFVSDKKLIAVIDIDAEADSEESRNVTVTNPDNQAFELEDGFDVTPVELPAPVIIDFAPEEGDQGKRLFVTIIGENFVMPVTVDFGEGVAVKSVNIGSPEQLIVEITIDPNAGATERAVTVTNSDGQSDSMKSFQVIEANPTPVIRSISPAHAAQGQELNVAITGEGFTEESTVIIGDDSNKIEFAETKFESEHVLQVQLKIENSPPGKYDVTVLNLEGKSDTEEDGFEVELSQVQP